MIKALVIVRLASRNDLDAATKFIDEMRLIIGLEVEEYDLSDLHRLYYWVSIDGCDSIVYAAVNRLKELKKKYEYYNDACTAYMTVYVEGQAYDGEEAYRCKMTNDLTRSDIEYARLVKKYEDRDVHGLLLTDCYVRMKNGGDENGNDRS